MTAPTKKKSSIAGGDSGGEATARVEAAPGIVLGGQAQLVRGGEPAAAGAAPAAAAHDPVRARRQEVQGGHEAVARRLVKQHIAHSVLYKKTFVSLIIPIQNTVFGQR